MAYARVTFEEKLTYKVTKLYCLAKQVPGFTLVSVDEQCGDNGFNTV
jgi:hypothetical protein